MAYAVEIAHVVIGLAVKHDIGSVKTRALTAVGEASAGGEIVLEAEHHSGAHLECIRIAIDFLKNEKLVIVLIRLRITHADTGHPCPLGHK